MKVNFYTGVSSNRKLNWWTFYLLPTIVIKRRDRFADEDGYYCWLKDIDIIPKTSCKDFKHCSCDDEE